MGNKHLQREIAELHKGQGHGCIWRHEDGYGSYRSTGCHYRKRGFQASAGRTDMYNKDHRAKAEELGYAKWDEDEEKLAPAGGSGSRLGKELKAAGSGKTGSALTNFRKKFRNKFQNSLRWLGYDPEGWHYGHREQRHPVRGAPSVEPTFKPRDKDTYAHGAWYPYHHEYHHLIAVEALRKYVITDADVDRRIQAFLATRWNINKGENVVFLPTEISVAAIVELPAHCPWDRVEHRSYSSSLKKHLDKVRSMLDDAMHGEESCEDEAADISQKLDELSGELLEAIKSQAGRALGAVSAPGGSP